MLPQQAQVGAAMAEHDEGHADVPVVRGGRAAPEDFPKLLDRMGEFMRTPYNWAEDVKKLTMPVMLVFGDSDMFRPEHMVEFYQAARRRPAGRRLACASTCQRTGSRSCPTSRTTRCSSRPRWRSTVLPFLDGKSGAKSWAEVAGGKKK